MNQLYASPALNIKASHISREGDNIDITNMEGKEAFLIFCVYYAIWILTLLKIMLFGGEGV